MAAGRTSSSDLRRRWWWSLAAICAAGLVTRVLFAVHVVDRELPGDASWFHEAAASLAAGHGFGSPPGHPSAAHPPLFSVVLAFFDLFGLDNVDAQRVAVAVLATAAVVLTGIVGRRVGGDAAGLVAAALAALNPLWFQSPGILMSESLYLVAVPGVLALAFWCIDRPSFVSFAALGVVVAAAVLTRSDAIGLIVLLGIPTVLLATKEWARRGVLAVALAAGLALVLLPWLVRNEIQLGGATLSTDGGVTLDGSYCPATFDPHSPSYGSFNIGCALVGAAVVYRKDVAKGSPPSDIAFDGQLQGRAEDFARAHLSDLPGEIAAREWSTWGPGTSTTNRRSPGPKVATHRGRQPAESWTGCSLPLS